MQNELLQSLLISLALTLILELDLALLCKIRDWHDLLLVFLVNLMTNPPVVLTHNLIRLGTPIVFTIVLEALVVVLEGLCYKYIARSIKHPYLFSAGANILSYSVGLLILRIVYGG